MGRSFPLNYALPHGILPVRFPLPMNCHVCGAALGATAKFCHKCGAALGIAQSTGWRAGLPWTVAGASGGALLLLVVLRLAGWGPGGANPAGADAAQPDAPLAPPTSPASSLGAPDISQMSPEERARRLFDRVMRLHSEGKGDSAQFFLPMARQAYAMLPALDLDARYDIGVLDLTAGDGAGAAAQADTILKAVPSHLYGLMLRARARELAGDRPGAVRAYRDFLRHERAERARQRPEYGEHATMLDAFHAEALQATVGARPAP